VVIKEGIHSVVCESITVLHLGDVDLVCIISIYVR